MNAAAQRYYVYILFSLTDRGLYIGYSKDLKKRIDTHEAGLVVSTRNRRPLVLLHYEYFINRADAKAREEYLKSGHGRQQIAQFLSRTLESLGDE